MKKKQADLKRYIIKRSVMATSAQEALILEKDATPEEVYLDVDYKAPPNADAIGFKLVGEYDGY